jgi:proteasome lid subunit RPN8/RPN11
MTAPILRAPKDRNDPQGRDSGGLLLVPTDIHHAMIDHCRQEAPVEACGLLGGVGYQVSSFHPLRNVRASATRYEADPQDLVTAVVWLREHRGEILAIYHSHPDWTAIPSRTDLETNYYGEVPRIIVSLRSDPPDVRIWRLYPNAYQELPWRLVP